MKKKKVYFYVNIFCNLIKAAIAVADKSAAYCFVKDEDPYKFFGSQTAYNAVRKMDRYTFQMPGCSLEAMIMITRHGTRSFRYNSMQATAVILPILAQNIVKNHENGHGQLCDEDIDNFRRYRFSGEGENSSYLLKQGYQDMLNLGERLKTSFPELFSNEYNEKFYKFRIARTRVTEISAYAFAAGLFGENTKVIIPKPLPFDPVLLGYHACTTWEDVTKQSLFFIQEKLFRQSRHMKKAVQSVNNRLGFTDSTLSEGEIDSIYDRHSYEQAWKPNSHSAFGASFTKDDLKVFEYKNDLHDYYKFGHGMDVLNKALVCPLMKEILLRLKDVIDGQDCPRVYFYFSHRGTQLLLNTGFDLFEDDEPLLYSNYEKYKTDRKFRTSVLAPFAGNIIFALYLCNNNDGTKSFCVVIFKNEEPIIYRKCSDTYTFYWECLWENYKHMITSDECNLNFC